MRGLTHSKTHEKPLTVGEGTWYAWCHKIEHRNCNHDTRNQNTVVLPVPVVNPTHSLGWDMRLAQQMQEKEDMWQERDSECHRTSDGKVQFRTEVRTPNAPN